MRSSGAGCGDLGVRGPPAGEELVEIEPGELSGVFAAPGWLRDLGFSSWLLVGVAAALFGAVWFLSLTHTIVMPVITAGIIASVTSPVVDWLKRHRVPRGAGAAIVFLAIVAIGIAVGVVVLTGIASQADSLSEKLQAGASEIESWAKDLGVDSATAKDANEHASASVSAGFQALTAGPRDGGRQARIVGGVPLLHGAQPLLPAQGRADDRGFVERHLGVPVPVARTVLGRVSGSLRGYFVGVTVVAAWSAAIVGAGALLLGVPLPGTIAVVTFVGGYVPYLGAWAAGAFAVLIALGAEGPETAAALAVVVLLANGVLQQIVQPIAYGAALGLHPLAVLIVTIAGGSLFGTIGLVLAAPLMSAAVRISADVSASRLAGDREEEEPAPAPPPEEAPPGAPELGVS